MAETTPPQIYLLTPADFAPDALAARLAPVLDRVEVACLRLALASQDEGRLLEAATATREIGAARGIAVTASDHIGVAERVGLDGVHLGDGGRNLRRARQALGADAIVGAYCGSSGHSGLSAGEAGADYVAFGPVAGSALYGGEIAETDLFAWWAEMIEVPLVAEGGLTAETVGALAPYVDFFALGEEVWQAPDPAGALATLVAATR